jgi:hypothetical protein
MEAGMEAELDSLLALVPEAGREEFREHWWSTGSEDRHALIEAVLAGDKLRRELLRESIGSVYEQGPPVGIEEFVTSKYFLGDVVRNLSPRWLDELKVVFAPGSNIVSWIMCLSGDTRVPLLSGGEKTLVELHEEWEKTGQSFWVYSIDQETKRPTPGLCTRVTKFGKDKLFKVTLDDGSTIRANQDHEFVCRDGVKRRLRDLNPGDRLMPFLVRGKKIFKTRYRNHMIVSIEECGFENVYCLTVPEWGNFAVSTNGRQGIYSGNTGAIGVGKTTVSTIAQVYKIYQLSCLISPQEYYGLNPGDRIVFAIFNITLKKGESGYDLLRYYVENSPYFRERSPSCKRPKDPIWFPKKNVAVVLGSLSTHALGEHVLGFAMDEANFFKSRVDVGGETRAHAIYEQAYTRLVSRYMQQDGKVPGLVCLLSSRKTQSAFLEEQIAKAERQTNKTMHVSSFALWDIKNSMLCGRTFPVLIGDDKMSSRVMEEDEVLPGGYDGIEVPIEFRDRFEWDVDDSLRDIAGIATVGSFHFFPRREFLEQAMDDSLLHPFNVETVDTLGLKLSNDLTEYMNERALFRVQNSMWVPIQDPGIPRYVHVDIGLTNDALGLAVGHRKIENGHISVVFDLVLRVKAPFGDEVHLNKIISFFKFLRSRGMPLAQITYDSFQSRHSIQDLILAGFNADTHSVSLDDYNTLKDLLTQGRCKFYRYEPLLTELRELRKDPEGAKRPNHPSGGSDDMADAVAAVAAACYKAEKSTITDSAYKPIFAMGSKSFF